MPFQCPLCTFADNKINLLHLHCVIAHPKAFYTCPWCTIPFKSLRSLQMHTINCEAFDVNTPQEGNFETMYVMNNECMKCESRFQSHQAAIKHYMELHLNVLYFCNVCHVRFQTFENWDRHYVDHHPPTLNSPPTARQQQQHQPQQQRESRQENDVTAEAMPTSTSTVNASAGKRARTLPNTLDIMKNARQFRCAICAVDFENREETRDHLLAIHNFTLVLCGSCDKMYSSAKCQRIHAPKCPGNQNIGEVAFEAVEQVDALEVVEMFPCSSCDFETTSRTLARIHINSHIEAMLQNMKSEKMMAGVMPASMDGETIEISDDDMD